METLFPGRVAAHFVATVTGVDESGFLLLDGDFDGFSDLHFLTQDVAYSAQTPCPQTIKRGHIATKPARYNSYPDLCDIIDFPEMFIETPKIYHLQACASTIKFLVSVTPTDMIAFVSNVFFGRASDKAVTKLSVF